MKQFYVYALFDADGVVRYIGKGCRSRWLQHITDKISPKPFVSEAIERIGDLPRIKIRENLTEREALTIEKTFIKAIGRFPDGPLVNRTDRSGPNSNQVKAWHATRSPEDRLKHMTPAIEASRVSPIATASRKRTIQFALNALTPEHWAAAAKRLNENYTTEQHILAGKKAAAATTPEIRSDRARKAIQSQSSAQLSATGRRRNDFITPEIRSEIGRKRSAHLSDEQRAINTTRLIGSQTKEQLSINGKKGAASLTPEMRSEAARKRAQTLGPDKIREITKKATATRARKRLERLQELSTETPQLSLQLHTEDQPARFLPRRHG